MKYTSLVCLCLGIVFTGCTRQNPIDKTSSHTPAPTSTTATNTVTASAVPTARKEVSRTPSKHAETNAESIASKGTAKTVPTSLHQPPTPPSSYEAKMARKALRFVEEQWKTARENGDIAAYTKLLTEDFKGSRTASKPRAEAPQSSTVLENRDEWLKKLSATMTGKQKIELGPPSVFIVRGPATRVTFRFPERVETSARCVVRDRELTVYVWEDRPTMLNNEIEQNEAACPDTDSAHVAGIHDQLKEHVAKYQPLDKYLQGDTFWLRDHGVTNGTFKGDYLQSDAGKWLLKILQESEADFDSTSFFGTVGCVRTKQNVTFVYAFEGKTWKLLGVNRRG